MVTFYALFHNATLLFLERLPFCLPFVWVLKTKRLPFLLGYAWVFEKRKCRDKKQRPIHRGRVAKTMSENCELSGLKVDAIDGEVW